MLLLEKSARPEKSIGGQLLRWFLASSAESAEKLARTDLLNFTGYAADLDCRVADAHPASRPPAARPLVPPLVASRLCDPGRIY